MNVQEIIVKDALLGIRRVRMTMCAETMTNEYLIGALIGISLIVVLFFILKRDIDKM